MGLEPKSPRVEGSWRFRKNTAGCPALCAVGRRRVRIGCANTDLERTTFRKGFDKFNQSNPIKPFAQPTRLRALRQLRIELCRQENAQLDGLPTAQPDFSVCYLRVICCRAAFSHIFFSSQSKRLKIHWLLL